MKYWKECISEALEDAGIKATDEQIETVTSWVEGAHDNYSMAHGYDCIPNPLAQENDRLKRALENEQNMVHCKECNGKGRIYESYGTRSSDSPCDKCHGEGRHSR